MNTQHIGAAGELLVQYQLLKLGIDSARLTTDAGIDLVVYSPVTTDAVTVQVKTNLGPKPAGGKGAPTRGWTFPHTCPAQVLALVALDIDTVWLFTLEQARQAAQQHSPRGIRNLYWYTGPGAAGARTEADMGEHLLSVQAPRLFLTGEPSGR